MVHEALKQNRELAEGGSGVCVYSGVYSEVQYSRMRWEKMVRGFKPEQVACAKVGIKRRSKSSWWACQLVE